MADNRNNPPKPNKDQKVNDLPQKKGAPSKDSQVRGGSGNAGRDQISEVADEM